MKTRTLMILAIGCGVVIMLAGAVFLFQLTGEPDIAAAVPLGESAAVGDMSVAVLRALETNGVLDVSVRLGGVADEDGAGGFRLIASGRPVSPDFGARSGLCGATTVSSQDCLVRFDVSTADGMSRVLFYERGDDQARWVLDGN